MVTFLRSESTSQFLLWSNDNLIYQELISKITIWNDMRGLRKAANICTPTVVVRSVHGTQGHKIWEKYWLDRTG